MTRPDSEEKPRVTAQTRMKDAIAADPNLPVVLMRFHIGGCSLCGFDENDTVAAVAADNGVPLQRLLAALNGDEEENRREPPTAVPPNTARPNGP